MLRYLCSHFPQRFASELNKILVTRFRAARTAVLLSSVL